MSRCSIFRTRPNILYTCHICGLTHDNEAELKNHTKRWHPEEK